MVQLLICLILLASVFCLIFLQTFSSVLLRVLGLLSITIAVVAHYFYTDFSGDAPYVIASVILLGLFGVLSDLYSATLRTWFFSVSGNSIKATIYGMFFGVLLFPMAFGLNLVHGMIFGTIIGVIIGESRLPGKKKFSRMIKSSLGTIVGIFGMATKTIVGIMMIDIFIRYSGFIHTLTPVLQTYI